MRKVKNIGFLYAFQSKKASTLCIRRRIKTSSSILAMKKMIKTKTMRGLTFLAVHGGAGVDPNLPTEHQEHAKQLLTRVLNLGIDALRSSVSAIDGVELVVRELESDPLFNSGRGSALTENGRVETEASIMDGVGRRCGAVSGLTTVKNLVSLACLHGNSFWFWCNVHIG